MSGFCSAHQDHDPACQLCTASTVPGDIFRAAAVARWRSACGHGTGYELGTGGSDPDAPHPGPKSRKWPKSTRLWSDCSGTVDWGLRLERKTDGVWYNTDGIERDALRPGGHFTRVLVPEPGDVLVYGNGPKIGHCAGVVEVGPRATAEALAALEPRAWRDTIIVDCSLSSWLHFKDAIREHDARGFRRKDTIFARLLLRAA